MLTRLERHQPAPGPITARADELLLDGLWPGCLKEPQDPDRDEYLTGPGDLRIVRVAGVRHQAWHDSPWIESLSVGERLLIVPEPANRHDPNALAVIARDDGERAGYIPASRNVEIEGWAGFCSEVKAWMLCHWVDPFSEVLWDGYNSGGSAHMIGSAHIILARPPAAEAVEAAIGAAMEEMHDEDFL